jgi:hypothetical protein
MGIHPFPWNGKTVFTQVLLTQNIVLPDLAPEQPRLLEK